MAVLGKGSFSFMKRVFTIHFCERKLQKRVFGHNLSPQYCVSICTGIFASHMTLPLFYMLCISFHRRLKVLRIVKQYSELNSSTSYDFLKFKVYFFFLKKMSLKSGPEISIIQLSSPHGLTLLLNKMHACNVCKYVMSWQKRNLFCIKLIQPKRHKKFAKSTTEYSMSE